MSPNAGSDPQAGCVESLDLQDLPMLVLVSECPHSKAKDMCSVWRADERSPQLWQAEASVMCDVCPPVEERGICNECGVCKLNANAEIPDPS